ncbi:DUF2199 domain-containing protein [Thermodesulfobacteriota bacterium]
MEFEFKYTTCGEIHSGIPTFRADKSLLYYEVPEEEREIRCDCGTEDCVIDKKFLYRGVLKYPLMEKKIP